LSGDIKKNCGGSVKEESMVVGGIFFLFYVVDS